MVGELLAHCDRLVDSDTGTPTAATPSGGTPTGATPSVRTSNVRTPSVGTPSPTGGTSAASATGAGVKVRLPPLTAAFVSITNNEQACGGLRAEDRSGGGYRRQRQLHRGTNFTVTGSEETRSRSCGPPTGSTYHVTVTCDNGLSTSVDKTY